MTIRACTCLALWLVACGGPPPAGESALVAFGEMHAVIGQGQHQGRVGLDELVATPHLYGVGAMEGLRGEVTLLDSEAIVTAVTGEGGLAPIDDADGQATLFVGRSVTRWTEVTLHGDVAPEALDETVRELAGEQGVDVSLPFVFVVEGELTDVRLHVINGACPIRARMKAAELDPTQRPFEAQRASVSGALVGVFADDAVGKLTHPDTSIHSHIVHVDEVTGRRVTGHVERAGVAAGAVLRLPAGDAP